MVAALMEWLLAQLTGHTFEVMAGMFCVMGTAEYCVPARSAPPLRSRVFNASYTVLTDLAAAALAPIASFEVSGIARHLTSGLIDLRPIGDLGGPLVAMIASAVVVDFFYYWFHRLQHRSQILWQEHLLHRSDEYLNVTTTARTHVVEQFLYPIFLTLPISVFFKLPPVAIALLTLVPTAWDYFIHSNTKISFGRFWWLLSSPQYHRIHHSVELVHANKNFAAKFPFWDVIFRTAYRPGPDEYPESGVEGLHIRTLVDAYIFPLLQWYRMWSSVETCVRTQK